MPYREGFACAGPWVVEHVREVTHYPPEGSVAKIENEHLRLGGAFPLMAELRGRHANAPLYAIGSLGEDENGHLILDDCHKLDIDTYQLCVKNEIATAHAEVILAQRSNMRTSFYSGGANDLLSVEHFDFRHCLASWFHLHDLTRLPALLHPAGEHRTHAGRVLQMAQNAGLITSLYVDQLPDAPVKLNLLSTLAFADHLIISENTLSQLMEFPETDLSREAIMTAVQQMMAKSALASVAIVDATAGGFVTRTGEFQWQEFAADRSIHFPQERFCARVIYDAYCKNVRVTNE
ncbi:hypothetical protein KJ068_19120 [bacterium]|nr:hypothetical protein [bacterium]